LHTFTRQQARARSPRVRLGARSSPLSSKSTRVAATSLLGQTGVGGLGGAPTSLASQELSVKGAVRRTDGSQCLVAGAERGFEPPVLFVVPALTKGSKFQPCHCAEADQRIVLRAIWPQILARKTRRTSAPSRVEKAKEDRRFESPPLHQRGAANRRSRSRDTKGLVSCR